MARKSFLMRLAALAAYGVILTVYWILDLPCGYIALFGFPCPGCGMTRAWLSVLQLDLSAAFRWHPMFWCIPLIAVCILYDGKLFPGKKGNLLFWSILGAGILMVYLARLLGFLGGFSLI